VQVTVHERLFSVSQVSGYGLNLLHRRKGTIAGRIGRLGMGILQLFLAQAFVVIRPQELVRRLHVGRRCPHLPYLASDLRGDGTDRVDRTSRPTQPVSQRHWTTFARTNRLRNKQRSGWTAGIRDIKQNIGLCVEAQSECTESRRWLL